LRLDLHADTATNFAGSDPRGSRRLFRLGHGAVAGPTRRRPRRDVPAAQDFALMGSTPVPGHRLGDRMKEIARQAWPVLIASWAGVAFGVIDTAMGGHAGALDLQVMALATSIYVTVFVGLMGVIHALIPILA